MRLLVGRRTNGLNEEIDIGSEQSVGIEMMVPLEQRTPEDCQQYRRDKKLREVAQARGPKLATLDAAIDELSERLDPARDNVLVVKLGELGMLVPFGDEKPHDNGAAGTDEFLNET